MRKKVYSEPQMSVICFTEKTSLMSGSTIGNPGETIPSDDPGNAI